MKKTTTDQNVYEEPHLKKSGFVIDPSEAKADLVLNNRLPKTEVERMDQSVVNEPFFESSTKLSDPSLLSYGDWLKKSIHSISRSKSWIITFAIVLSSGLWGILGAFFSVGEVGSLFLSLTIVVFGPAAEEIMKIAIPFWIVEKRPYVFRSKLQIAICILASAFVFAAVENFLYLKVYVAKPTEMLMHWRWTVCVALHMGCAFIGGMGVMRIWKDCLDNFHKPRIALGFPFFVTALVTHGTYNGFAVFLELSKFHF